MAIEYLRESTLSNSEVFQGLNNLGGKSSKDKAIELIKTAKHLSPDDLESSYIILRQMNDNLTRAGIKAFENDKVVIIYNNNPKLSLTQGIPFLTFKQAAGYITYIFADRFITLNRDGVLTIQSAILRDFLISGAISNGIKNNYRALSSNQFLAKLFMEIYSKLFTRVINREYSIGANKELFDSVHYWVNRFFLERVFESADNKENIEKMSSSVYKYTDEVKAAQNQQDYDNHNITKLSHLLLLINESSPRMKTLQLGTFLNAYCNYLYPPALLGVDNIEYFIMLVIMLMGGNNIINIAASDIVKEAKGIKNLKPELEKLI